MEQGFYQFIEQNPVIAAVKTKEDLQKALESPVGVIFMLGGNICQLQENIAATRSAEKKLFIHLDLLEGMGKDEYALRYLQKIEHPDGVLTTKSNLVRHARECGLFVIQRIFMLDSMSFETGAKSVYQTKPHAIEIMPGIMPGVIQKAHSRIQAPIIAGGFISTKEDVFEALNAGALGVSTTCHELWFL